MGHTMRFYMNTLSRTCFLTALLLSPLGGVLKAQAQTFSEPHTVFYGKVLGTASAQNFLITTGQLSWTIQRADGVSVTLNTTLYSYNDNTFSYRLNVPHSAIALGLDSNVGGIPLPPVPQINIHAEITVDGQTATLLGPAGVAFTTEQLLRTATYRLDLGLNRAALDTDGDGIPDWWEDLYGLDKQNPNDASLDINGDGLSALHAYQQGLDPNKDGRIPTLLTGDLIVYPAGATAVLLDTADLDSTPAQIVYTLASIPNAGSLVLRNAQTDPEQPDVVLNVGGQFTQADLLKGRLVFEHDGSNNDPGSFDVTVGDENPEHPADQGTVHLLSYEPADLVPENVSDLELQRLDHHFYADAGYVIHDGSLMSKSIGLSTPSAGLDVNGLLAYQASYGNDLPYVISGNGSTNTTLIGGHRGDVLIAGSKGGVMTGGIGNDWFVLKSFSRGLATISDFKPSDNDVVDMSRLPSTPGAFVHQYLRVIKTGGVHRIQTDLDGNGVGFTNLVVALPGLSDADADIYSLVQSGRLLVGFLQLEPMISVSASQSQASENSGSEGRFTITRQGSLNGDLTVNVIVSGSAQNGTDYMLISTSVLVPSGAASVDVPVVPYPDGLTEPVETVQLNIAAGQGYRIGTANQAIVTIEDLLMLVEIEAIEPIAVKDTVTPGTFMITRRDVINRDVAIRLTIAGTAANGTDYNTLSTLVYMAPNQTVAFLNVVPKTTAQLAGGLETVSITIKTDVNYRVVSGAGVAQVLIIERNDSFAGWRAREFPGEAGDAATFALGDTGNTGISHLQRYAFGLDPHQPDLEDLPRPLVHDGKLVVTFRKPAGVNDVQYRVTASADLMNWSDQSVSVTQISDPAGASTDPVRVYYQADEEGDATFIVVEAEWLP